MTSRTSLKLNSHENLVQAEQDRVVRVNEAMSWSTEDGEPAVCLEFDTSQCGLKVELEGRKPIDFFKV